MLFPSLGFSQQYYDSLWSVWKDKSIEDTSRLDAVHILISDKYVFSQVDTALILSQEQYRLAIKTGIHIYISNALNMQGVSYYVKGNYDLALEKYTEDFELNIKNKDELGTAISLNNIAMIHEVQGNQLMAIDYYTKSLKIREKLKDKEGIAATLNNIGLMYKGQGDLIRALDYYNKCLEISLEIEGQFLISASYSNIGEVYANSGKFEQAMEQYNNCIHINKATGDQLGLATSYLQMGDVNKNLEDFNEAMEYYKLALQTYERLGNMSGIGKSNNSIGDLERYNKDYKKAIQYSTKALSIAQETGEISEINAAAQSLYESYKSIGNKTLALEMHELYYLMRDSILNEKNQQGIIRQEYKYTYDKQVAADSIKHAEEEKVTTAKLQASEAQKKQQKQLSYFLTGFLIFAIVFGAFIFNRQRITKRQKKVIEEQKYQIIESINYSKKIQSALLPDIDDIQKTLSDVFIYYKPKDIVSGDFYWYKDFRNHALLACVDCTGHGVPGGFMSTLGSLLLDKIGDKDSFDTAAILKNLSDEIIQALQQEKGGDIQDGMDISLCLIDKQKQEIKFSGARNGIMVVHENEATRYRASPLPVGGSFMKKGKPIVREFPSQTILFEKDDWIFMYTDGYLEQPGGDDDLPMNSKEFSSILCKTVDVSTTSEKMGVLEGQFNTWKRDNDQFDDILIIGFKPTFGDT